MRLVSKAGLDVKKKTVEALKTNLADDEAEGLDSDDETDLSDRLAGVDLEDSDQGLAFFLLAKPRGIFVIFQQFLYFKGKGKTLWQSYSKCSLGSFHS